MADASPPIGDSIQQVDVVLAQGDEVVTGEDAAEGLGDGEAEVVAGRVETVGDFLVAVGDELAEAVGGDGGEDGDSGGGDIGVGEVKIGADASANCLPEVGSETGGTNKVKGKLFGDGGGGRGDDLFDGGFGKDGDVAASSGLLESLEESARLAEGIVGAEVRLDLSEQNVHFTSCFRN